MREASMFCTACGSKNQDPAAFCWRCGRDLTLNKRMIAATDPNTTPGDLEWLAGDQDDLVRYRVAGNRNTPLNVLVRLARDNDAFVVRGALRSMDERIKRGDSNVLTARTNLIENDARPRAVWDERFSSPIYQHNFEMDSVWGRIGIFIVVGLVLVGICRAMGC